MSDTSYYRGKLFLVAGGTGFVGTAIAKALLAEGARVRLTVHNRKPIVAGAGVETVAADLTKLEDCQRAMQGVDGVFHCAGAVSAAGVTTGRNPLAPIATNLILTVQLFQAAWTTGVDRFMMFSSSTAYPVTQHPVREEELWEGPTHPTYFGYGWSRRYMERLAEFVAKQSKVKVAIVRPTAVYGPHDNFDPATSHMIPALIRKAVEKMNPYEVWGAGDEIRDSLHVEDLARGCLLALEKHANADPINIGLGKGAAVKEIVAIILKAAGHENAQLKFDASKPTTIPVRLVDVSKAERALGFKPRYSLEQGLRQTVDWYRVSLAQRAREGAAQ